MWSMLRVWVHGCDPGRVSDGSRLALCQTLSIECPSSIFFWHVYFVIIVPLSLSFCLFVFFFCSHWSLVDVPLTFSSPAGHVSDWQLRILLGMVEARSVNVKKTTTTTTIRTSCLYLTPENDISRTSFCQETLQITTSRSRTRTSPQSNARHVPKTGQAQRRPIDPPVLNTKFCPDFVSMTLGQERAY